jgi:hypothetical protein
MQGEKNTFDRDLMPLNFSSDKGIAKPHKILRILDEDS